MAVGLTMGELISNDQKNYCPYNLSRKIRNICVIEIRPIIINTNGTTTQQHPKLILQHESQNPYAWIRWSRQNHNPLQNENQLNP